MPQVFITGASGYIGTRVIKQLLNDKNFLLTALVREGAEQKIPQDCSIVVGDALNAETYTDFIKPGCIFIHLVGVAHPSPSKKKQFETIDFVSVKEAARAATQQKAAHFIYLSVAMHPTRIMREFQQVRARGEALLQQSGLPCSFIRPWYVVGPGHWWPLLLKPLYWLLRLVPSTSETAKKLDTVTIRQMVNTLVHAVQEAPMPLTIYEVKDIQQFN